VTVPHSPLKDDAGRWVPGALFTVEIRKELAAPDTDDSRRSALRRELLYRQGASRTTSA